MPDLEQEFPGLRSQIRALRALGLSEPEIVRAIAEHAQLLRQSGYSGEAIDAYLHGRPSPVTIRPIAGVFTPAQLKQLQEFERSTTVSPEEMARFRRGDWRRGLMRGVLDATVRAGQVLVEEITGAPQQFFQGLGRVVSGESSVLERAMGAVEAATAPLRAVLAPVTAATRPLAETIVAGRPLPQPEEVNPLARAIVETGLQLGIPGIGLPGALQRVRLGEAGRIAEDIARRTLPPGPLMPPLAAQRAAERAAVEVPPPRPRVEPRPAPRARVEEVAPPAQRAAPRVEEAAPQGPAAEIANAPPPAQIAERVAQAAREVDQSTIGAQEMRLRDLIASGTVSVEDPRVQELIRQGLLRPRARPVQGTAPREVLERSRTMAIERRVRELRETIARGELPTQEVPLPAASKAGIVGERVRRLPTEEEAKAARVRAPLTRAATALLKAAEEVEGRAPRPLTEFTPEQLKIVVTQRLVRQGMSKEQAQRAVEAMTPERMQIEARAELDLFRRLERGPRAPSARTVPVAPRVLERFVGASGEVDVNTVRTFVATGTVPERVRLPARPKPEDVGIPRVSLMKRIAEQRGFELQVHPDRVRLIREGGESHDFRTLHEANAFLLTQAKKPLQPAVIKSTGTGESAFEAAALGKPLTKEQRINLQKQRALVKEQKPPIDQELPKTEVTQPVRELTLPENAVIGTVEDLRTAEEAVEVMRRAHQLGFATKAVRLPDGGFEVVFMRARTVEGRRVPVPEAQRAFELHRRVLQMGPKSVSEEAHRELGRAFGIPEEQIEQFIKDFKTGGAPIEGASEAGPIRRALTRLAWRLSPDRPSGEMTRIVNPLAGGFVQTDPLLRQFTRDMYRAELAYTDKLKQYRAELDELAKLAGGGKGTPAARRALALRQGTIRATSAADKRLLERTQEILADFERRAVAEGLLKEGQTFANVARFETDLDALYNVFRTHFISAQGYSRLDPMVRANITPEQFARAMDIFLKHPTRKTLTRDMERFLRRNVFDFSAVANTPEHLPQFVRDSLPPETYVQLTMPRARFQTGDFFEQLERFMAATEFKLQFHKPIKLWSDIAKQLPGSSGNPFTQKGWIELALKRITGARAWDERVMEDLFNATNNLFGRELLKAYNVDLLARLAQTGFLRGALGPDSALINIFGGFITAWAENGRFVGPLMKLVKARGRINTPGVLTEFIDFFGPEAKGNTPLARQILRFNRAVTDFVLSPMTITENLNRGFAFEGGFEKAAAMGLNWKDAIKVGFAEASKVFPDLKLTEAHLAALESMIRSQVGFTPATRAPLLGSRGPLGRLSTVLVSYPPHFLQFLNFGLRKGFADAMLKHDPSTLIRFTALLGFFVGIPIVGAQLGVDLRNAFGPKAMLPLLSLPFFRSIINAYNVVVGDDPITVEQAKRELRDFFGTMTIPAYRWGKKFKDVTENIARGYAVDRRGRFLYETTTWGEIARLFGVGPEEAYDARQLARTLHNEAIQYRLDKQNAVDALLDGDPSGVALFMQKWGRPITPQDLQRAMLERMKRPEQRAVRGLPRPLGQMLILEEATR